MKHLIRIRAFLKPYLWQTLATLITLLILTGLSLIVPRILSSVIDNGLKGGAPYLAQAALLLLGEAPHESVREQCRVARAIPQRGHRDDDLREPVEQVFPELA